VNKYQDKHWQSRFIGSDFRVGCAGEDWRWRLRRRGSAITENVRQNRWASRAAVRPTKKGWPKERREMALRPRKIPRKKIQEEAQTSLITRSRSIPCRR